MSTSTREVVLLGRPDGRPDHDLFEVRERELPAPSDGQVLVRNSWMSVDPYMRGRMNDVKSYTPPFEVGEPLDGGAVGEVVASAADGVAEGDLVLHALGWREHALVDASKVQVLDGDVGVPPQAWLGPLGMPGLTAWAGVARILEVEADHIVWVNAAAGAVGSLVAQLAARRGATVVGSAGGEQKSAWLEGELGIAGVDYRQADGDGAALAAMVREAVDGALLDRVFDNVGGSHLEAAIAAAAVQARIAVCGAIEVYNATEPPAAPRNLTSIIGKRIRIEGMLVRDHQEHRDAFVDEVAPLVASGELVTEETVLEGLDNAVDAFLGLFDGSNTGKMLVSL